MFLKILGGIEMGRVLAIDYGLKRTGIAVTDPLGIIANPLTTIPTHELMNFIKEYFIKESVDKVIIGLPVNLENKSTDSTPHVLGFIKRLNKEIPGIIVETLDERFTSKIAKDSMILSGITKKKRRDKSLVDKISATLILQTYLGI